MRPALFIAIPRTGSTSVRAALEPHGLHEIRLSDGEHGQSFDPDRDCTTFNHAGVPAVVTAGICTQEWLDGRFVFAFLRNPWDRLVSLYHYLFRTLAPRHGRLEFPNFVQRVTEPMDSIGAYNWRGLSQANPQTDWLAGVAVDFVGRVEHFARDWARLCEVLDIDACLPRVNESPKRRPYREYYTPTLTRQVAARYAADIEAGHYEFHSEPTQFS